VRELTLEEKDVRQGCGLGNKTTEGNLEEPRSSDLFR
jgi:hypothetical protein